MCQWCRGQWIGWRPPGGPRWGGRWVTDGRVGRRLDASALRDWAHTSVGDLIAHTDEINRLNVFPVADADTGTNMLFTMRSAWAQADARPATATWPGGRGPGRRCAARRSRQLRGDPVADSARPGRRHRGPPPSAAASWPTSTASSSLPRCATRSVWSSPRWANPCRAPSCRCCRPPPRPPRTPARRRRRPRRRGRRRGGCGGDRPGQDHRAARRAGRCRRGRRRWPRAAGAARRADHARDRSRAGPPRVRAGHRPRSMPRRQHPRRCGSR